MLQSADANHEYVKALILGAATERYNEMPDPGPCQRLRDLVRQVRENPEDEETLWAFCEAAASHIRMGQGGIELAPMPVLKIQHREELAV